MASTFSKTGRNIICIGRNYIDHAKELGNKVPKEPFYFLKPTSSYLQHGQGKIEIPRGVVAHHEVELGVVIGKGGRDIPPSKAFDHVAGYTLAIDVTGRNMQDVVKGKGLPWAAAKGFDTFAPVGRFIPKSSLPDPDNVGLTLSINGQTKQSGVTGDMQFKIPQLIGHVSSIFGLNEGDLIMTGTPAGVGEMKPSDKITVRMTSPGLEGEVVDELEWDCVQREGGYEFKG
ncbi:hypothetical protein FFLO_01560 [Filobasidium floriforme]|uniref:Fumarylacetoacetase-like C-terminal domain-containing protein n=1 Tax=Filobasidium floriforme TaxID=5210 RepID=A0A8K0JQ15_9TREE|nr:putative mitochondrion protein [Filobasidium floriforme]KAG7563002.1 hypothetical protein FFLO_01560 [Filobasidium floriforme]KAH8079263.1 putative mitochondrion protein [Filobasidium floriforme]